MTDESSVVYIVDDDPSIRKFLRRLVSLAGLQSETFTSAEEFLRGVRPDTPGVLLLDIMMPGLSGLDLQRTLSSANIRMPIIFITGHGDIPMSVQAMKAGAVSFLTKPLRNQELLDAIQEAVRLDQVTRDQRNELSILRQRYTLLTPRERQVFALVVTGLLNKQIAGDLSISERTVKAHRKEVVRKLAANSVADLVRTAERLALPPPNVQHYQRRQVSLSGSSP
jgi:FixJ family two-component response regulator